jgi:hypothetical protein
MTPEHIGFMIWLAFVEPSDPEHDFWHAVYWGLRTRFEDR